MLLTKKQGSLQVVFCCCSSAVCWLAGMPSRGARASIRVLSSIGTWQWQAAIPWHKCLPKTLPILPTRTCICLSLYGTGWGAASLNVMGLFTADSHGLFCFTTSEAERLTKLLISKMVVSAVVWESRFSRECFWRPVVPVACWISRDKPWNSTSLPVVWS